MRKLIIFLIVFALLIGGGCGLYFGWLSKGINIEPIEATQTLYIGESVSLESLIKVKSIKFLNNKDTQEFIDENVIVKLENDSCIKYDSGYFTAIGKGTSKAIIQLREGTFNDSKKKVEIDFNVSAGIITINKITKPSDLKNLKLGQFYQFEIDAEPLQWSKYDDFELISDFKCFELLNDGENKGLYLTTGIGKGNITIKSKQNADVSLTNQAFTVKCNDSYIEAEIRKQLGTGQLYRNDLAKITELNLQKETFDSYKDFNYLSNLKKLTINATNGNNLLQQLSLSNMKGLEEFILSGSFNSTDELTSFINNASANLIRLELRNINFTSGSDNKLSIKNLEGLKTLILSNIKNVNCLEIDDLINVGNEFNSIETISLNNNSFIKLICKNLSYLKTLKITSDNVSLIEEIDFDNVNSSSYLNENNQFSDDLINLKTLSIASFRASELNLENLKSLENITLKGDELLDDFDTVRLANKSYESITIEDIRSKLSDSEAVVSLFNGILTRPNDSITIINNLTIKNAKISNTNNKVISASASYAKNLKLEDLNIDGNNEIIFDKIGQLESLTIKKAPNLTGVSIKNLQDTIVFLPSLNIDECESLQHISLEGLEIGKAIIKNCASLDSGNINNFELKNVVSNNFKVVESSIFSDTTNLPNGIYVDNNFLGRDLGININVLNSDIQNVDISVMDLGKVNFDIYNNIAFNITSSTAENINVENFNANISIVDNIDYSQFTLSYLEMSASEIVINGGVYNTSIINSVKFNNSQSRNLYNNVGYAEITIPSALLVINNVMNCMINITNYTKIFELTGGANIDINAPDVKFDSLRINYNGSSSERFNLSNTNLSDEILNSEFNGMFSGKEYSFQIININSLNISGTNVTKLSREIFNINELIINNLLKFDLMNDESNARGTLKVLKASNTTFVSNILDLSSFEKLNILSLNNTNIETIIGDYSQKEEFEEFSLSYPTLKELDLNNFILPVNVKTFSLDSINLNSWYERINKINVEYLSLKNCDISDSKVLDKFIVEKTIDLTGNNFVEFNFIDAYLNLEEMILDNCDFLKTIKIDLSNDNNITSDAINALLDTKYLNVETLLLKNVSMVKLDLNQFPNIKNLEIINTSFLENLLIIDNLLIDNINIQDCDFNKLTIKNSFGLDTNYLSIDKCVIKELAISSCPSLNLLNLTNCNIEHLIIEKLEIKENEKNNPVATIFNNKEKFNYTNTKINKSLSLSFNGLNNLYNGSDHIELIENILKQNETINTLDISGNNFSEISFNNNNIFNLKSINLNDSKYLDSIEILGENGNLRELKLNGLKSLKTLILKNIEFSELEIPALEKLSTIIFDNVHVLDNGNINVTIAINEIIQFNKIELNNSTVSELKFEVHKDDQSTISSEEILYKFIDKLSVGNDSTIKTLNLENNEISLDVNITFIDEEDNINYTLYDAVIGMLIQKMSGLETIVLNNNNIKNFISYYDGDGVYKSLPSTVKEIHLCNNLLENVRVESDLNEGGNNGIETLNLKGSPSIKSLIIKNLTHLENLSTLGVDSIDELKVYGTGNIINIDISLENINNMILDGVCLNSNLTISDDMEELILNNTLGCEKLIITSKINNLNISCTSIENLNINQESKISLTSNMKLSNLTINAENYELSISGENVLSVVKLNVLNKRNNDAIKNLELMKELYVNYPIVTTLVLDGAKSLSVLKVGLGAFESQIYDSINNLMTSIYFKGTISLNDVSFINYNIFDNIELENSTINWLEINNYNFKKLSIVDCNEPDDKLENIKLNSIDANSILIKNSNVNNVEINNSTVNDILLNDLDKLQTLKLDKVNLGSLSVASLNELKTLNLKNMDLRKDSVCNGLDTLTLLDVDLQGSKLSEDFLNKLGFNTSSVKKTLYLQNSKNFYSYDNMKFIIDFCENIDIYCFGFSKFTNDIDGKNDSMQLIMNQIDAINFEVDYVENNKIYTTDEIWQLISENDEFLTLNSLNNLSDFSLKFNINSEYGDVNNLVDSNGIQTVLFNLNCNSYSCIFDVTVSFMYFDIKFEKVIENIKFDVKHLYDIYFESNYPSFTYTTNYTGSKGGVMTPMKDCNYYKASTLTKNAFYIDGMTFKGWSLTPDSDISFTNVDEVSSLTSNEHITLYAIWEINTREISQYVTTGTIVENTLKNDKYIVYNTIDSTPWNPLHQKTIIDWRNETVTDLTKHTNRSVVSNRYNNIDIVAGYSEEVIFIGNKNKTFTNFRMHLCSYTSSQNLTLTFDNFKFTTNESTAIALYAATGINLTINVLGESSISPSVTCGNIINLSGAESKLNFIGSGKMTIYSGSVYGNATIQLVKANSISCNDCIITYEYSATYKSSNDPNNDYTFKGWYCGDQLLSESKIYVAKVTEFDQVINSAWYNPLGYSTSNYGEDDFSSISEVEKRYVSVYGGSGSYEYEYGSDSGAKAEYDGEFFRVYKEKDDKTGNAWLKITDNITKQTITYTVTWSTNGCFTGDTLVALDDGSYARLDSLKPGDLVLSWNAFTGTIEAMPISLFWNHGEGLYNVITLEFSNGKSLNVVTEHGFFDATLNKYVFINYENYDDYIGHKFAVVGEEGTIETVELVSGIAEYKWSSCYSLRSACNDNVIVEGFLTLTIEDIPGFLTYFEFGDDYKYDKEKMESDIAQYGLYTYEEWQDYVSYEEFIALNGEYLSIVVGKGYITREEILMLIEGMR